MQLFASLIVACVVSITPAGAHLLCFDGLSSLLVRDYKKSDRVKLCRSTITGESAGALILFYYSQLLKKLCLL